MYLSTSVSSSLNWLTWYQVPCCLQLAPFPLVEFAFHYFGRTKNISIMKHGTCIEMHWKNSFPVLTSRFRMFRMVFLSVVLHFLFLWWKWAIFAPKTNRQPCFQQPPIQYELLRTQISQHINRAILSLPLRSLWLSGHICFLMSFINSACVFELNKM